MLDFTDKNIVITGGTGSLGKCFVKRVLSGHTGTPKKLVVFSRDEAKQHSMRMEYLQKEVATDDIIYNNFKRLVQFRIGDVRSYESVCSVLKGADIVVHAAALKQVPSCEYFPQEAFLTNVGGASNIIRAIQELDIPVKKVVGISTDKACKPVNSYGMTKAVQERLFTAANTLTSKTSFFSVRYGNVLASRGSVIPLFHEQIKNGKDLSVTTEKMTRFFFSLDEAVDVIFAALEWAKPGDVYVPHIPSFTMVNIAKALIGDRSLSIKFTGIRPGEKEHEELISDVEAPLTYEWELKPTQPDGSWKSKKYYAIMPMLPELQYNAGKASLECAYSSKDQVLNLEETIQMLKGNNLL